MSAQPVRKKHTGEPGNPGEFGTLTRTASGLALGSDGHVDVDSALAEINDLDTTPERMVQLSHHPDPRVRAAAAGLVADRGRYAELCFDPDPTVREHAAFNHAAIHPGWGESKPLPTGVNARLREAKFGKDPGVLHRLWQGEPGASDALLSNPHTSTFTLAQMWKHRSGVFREDVRFMQHPNVPEHAVAEQWFGGYESALASPKLPTSVVADRVLTEVARPAPMSPLVERALELRNPPDEVLHAALDRWGAEAAYRVADRADRSEDVLMRLVSYPPDAGMDDPFETGDPWPYGAHAAYRVACSARPLPGPVLEALYAYPDHPGFPHSPAKQARSRESHGVDGRVVG